MCMTHHTPKEKAKAEKKKKEYYYYKGKEVKAKKK